ncbi:hypothetical protein ABW19_dt0204819 [Dactylella cylindrospora]|nr:hypothetical protein ABW19_dt0204819 [Dactylella cylindrospora]
MRSKLLDTPLISISALLPLVSAQLAIIEPPAFGTRDGRRYEATAFNGTTGCGRHNLATGIDEILYKTHGNLPKISAGGDLRITVKQITVNGGGPYFCSIDESGSGEYFRTVEVTTQVPGKRGINDGRNQEYPLVVKLPVSLRCSGTSGATSQICIVRCSNQRRDGFGGCVPVQQALTGIVSTHHARHHIHKRGMHIGHNLLGRRKMTGIPALDPHIVIPDDGVKTPTLPPNLTWKIGLPKAPIPKRQTSEEDIGSIGGFVSEAPKRPAARPSSGKPLLEWTSTLDSGSESTPSGSETSGSNPWRTTAEGAKDAPQRGPARNFGAFDQPRDEEHVQRNWDAQLAALNAEETERASINKPSFSLSVKDSNGDPIPMPEDRDMSLGFEKSEETLEQHDRRNSSPVSSSRDDLRITKSLRSDLALGRSKRTATPQLDVGKINWISGDEPTEAEKAAFMGNGTPIAGKIPEPVKIDTKPISVAPKLPVGTATINLVVRPFSRRADPVVNLSPSPMPAIDPARSPSPDRIRKFDYSRIHLLPSPSGNPVQDPSLEVSGAVEPGAARYIIIDQHSNPIDPQVDTPKGPLEPQNAQGDALSGTSDAPSDASVVRPIKNRPSRTGPRPSRETQSAKPIRLLNPVGREPIPIEDAVDGTVLDTSAQGSLDAGDAAAEAEVAR